MVDNNSCFTPITKNSSEDSLASSTGTRFSKFRSRTVSMPRYGRDDDEKHIIINVTANCNCKAVAPPPPVPNNNSEKEIKNKLLAKLPTEFLFNCPFCKNKLKYEPHYDKILFSSPSSS